MNKVYWVLGNKKYSDYNKFITDVTIYNEDISKDNEWSPSNALIYNKKIIVGYEALWKDEDDIIEITIESKNDEFITMGDILFKINNDSIDFFKEADACFFEGIVNLKKKRKNIPLYALLIGS